MGVDEAIDITAAERKTVLDLLDRHLPNTTAWVYGSRVKWTSRPQSDLDLVVFPTPGQRGRVGDLREAFDESDLPFRVDLFVWDDVPASFRTRIDAEHVPLTRPTRPSCPDGWVQRRLGDVIVLKRGYDLPDRERHHGPVPVVSSSGITDHHSESRAPGPGVVTGRYGTLGRVFFVPNDFWPLNTALYVQDFKGNDPRFISYFLRSLDFSRFSDKAAVPGLNRNHLHEETVRIPGAVAEQRAIAHVLGTLDDKIELNRRMNATLEAMARALFRSWFVDFHPVRAKMEGRATGLPKDLDDLFPDRLVDAGLGELPEGWEVSEIGAEVDAVGGATPSTKEPAYWDGGQHHWATPKDLSKLLSPVLLETERKITDEGAQKISSGLLPPGTVLLSSRAPIGYLAITEVPTAVNQGFIAMICRKRLPALYVLSWCYENLERIKDISGGTTFAEISKKAFRPLPIVVPPKTLLELYGQVICSLHGRVVANTREAALLASLRDLVLPKLVAGELRATNTDRAAGGH